MSFDSSVPELTDEERDGAKRVALRSLLLWEASVQRGDAEAASVGQVDGQIGIEPSADGGELRYLITGEYNFLNEEGERIVLLSSSFALTYVTPFEEPPSKDFVEAFSKSVIMQVTPFQREWLATMTNRLGLPPFYLPLMRQGDIVLTPGDATPPREDDDLTGG